jgi:hypothetical protein
VPEDAVKPLAEEAVADAESAAPLLRDDCALILDKSVVDLDAVRPLAQDACHAHTHTHAHTLVQVRVSACLRFDTARVCARCCDTMRTRVWQCRWDSWHASHVCTPLFEPPPARAEAATEQFVATLAVNRHLHAAVGTMQTSVFLRCSSQQTRGHSHRFGVGWPGMRTLSLYTVSVKDVCALRSAPKLAPIDSRNLIRSP